MWEVHPEGITNLNATTVSFISWEEFELLTGRKRIGFVRDRKINITRDKGHVHFYDTKFIPNERYKNNGRIYICRVVSEEDGIGVFEPTSKELKVILTEDTASMEIVT